MSTGGISNIALETVAERIDTRPNKSDAIPIVVFNPLGWVRSGEVTVKVRLAKRVGEAFEVFSGSGAVLAPVIASDPDTGISDVSIPVQDVPALGYRLLTLSTSKKDFSVLPPEESNELSIEDDYLRVVVDNKTGCISSLFDKTVMSEMQAPGSCGNQLQTFNDTPKQYDAWNIDPGTLDQAPEVVSNVSWIGPFDNGEWLRSIRIERHWQNSKFVQTISLKAIRSTSTTTSTGTRSMCCSRRRFRCP
jgi:alpha-mannosidase